LHDLRLRDFRTVHGQRIIASIAKDNPTTGHKTLLRIKSFLSGTLKHAKREGLIDSENPMRDVSVPGKAKKFKGPVYSLREIYDMAQHLSGVAAVIVATAAFTGLRLAELRGLQWKDFDGTSLKISRTVWRTRIGDTKNPESEGTVPVLPILQQALIEYRKQVSGKENDWLFKGERGAPMNLDNLVRRVIVPMITRCSICREMKSKHGEKDDHKFVLDTKIPNWRGWHSFRRSLASNLYSMGVKPKVLQAILRHSDIGTTLAYYVETPDDETREALDKIDTWVTQMSEREWNSIQTPDGKPVSVEEFFAGQSPK
jgi:integrase